MPVFVVHVQACNSMSSEKFISGIFMVFIGTILFSILDEVLNIGFYWLKGFGKHYKHKKI